MIKVKLKRFIAMTMAFCLTILPSNAFATEIDLENSSANVNKHGTVTKDSGSDTFDDETTNVWQNGTIAEEVRVKVDVASSFTITIPKEIVLNGNDGSATYKVKCEGEIAGDQVISVVPDNSFTLYEDGGKETPVTVTQPDTDFTYVELNDAKEYDGSLSAPEISAGNWSGKFNFNIEFKSNSSSTLPAKTTFNNMSWADISTVSEAGEAANYFNIGDEKELTIKEYSYYDSYSDITVTHPKTTYHVQILGFNHDDKSDGTGKAGITVGLKEIMTTNHNMNDTNTNVGGWEASKMRTYINNDVYNSLSSDLQAVIKTVDKKSDNGNMDTTTLNTTQDKLFLLSFEEIGFTSTNDKYFVSGQGVKYSYFTDNISRVRNSEFDVYTWFWLRSATTGSSGNFRGVDNVTGVCDTTYLQSSAKLSGGVFFAFCI